MNVIDFHVTKILSEKYGKVYELYGMTLEKAQSHPKSLWREYLLSDGVLQEYEFWDYGGTRTEKRVSTLADAYYPGYVGQHANSGSSDHAFR